MGLLEIVVETMRFDEEVLLQRGVGQVGSLEIGRVSRDGKRRCLERERLHRDLLEQRKADRELQRADEQGSAGERLAAGRRLRG
jgi:hypothetical protein